MKARLILIPMILATGLAMADHLPTSSTTKSIDGQSQAAALLSPQQKNEANSAQVVLSTTSAVSASTTTDAHAQAAGLLSRPR